ETPRAFMASAMRALASGDSLDSAACSGGAISWPSASSADILASQSPDLTGGTGNGPAATSAKHERTDAAARRIAIRRMDGTSQPQANRSALRDPSRHLGLWRARLVCRPVQSAG